MANNKVRKANSKNFPAFLVRAQWREGSCQLHTKRSQSSSLQRWKEVSAPPREGVLRLRRTKFLEWQLDSMGVFSSHAYDTCEVQRGMYGGAHVYYSIREPRCRTKQNWDKEIKEFTSFDGRHIRTMFTPAGIFARMPRILTLYNNNNSLLYNSREEWSTYVSKGFMTKVIETFFFFLEKRFCFVCFFFFFNFVAHCTKKVCVEVHAVYKYVTSTYLYIPQ
jgi:hypothetical protein